MTDEARLVRAPVVRIVDHGRSTTVLGPTMARRFDGDSAALLRAVLEIHARPVSRTRLLTELAARAGMTPAPTQASQPAVEPAPPSIPVEPIDQLVALLVADGVLVTARESPTRHAGALRRVVLGISGAIAAVDAPSVIRGLHAAGCDVRVALTRSAAKLVSRVALDALTHHQVWGGLWQRSAELPVPHVNLAEWAELVLIYPASATTLSRIATGNCADLVAAIAAATRAPVVVVPSMNDAMYESPAVQANLAALRDHGHHVVHPALGIEVAHPPHARASLLGPAPPASAVIDIVLHLLRELAARPRVPATARSWEQLWAATPVEQLPWYTAALDAPLTAALAARHAPGRRLVDLGTGDGVVAIAAARCGFHVTAVDIAPSALGAARDRAERAGVQAMVFVLDDVTAPRLGERFAVAVDRGLLHSLPRDRWPSYAAGIDRLVAAGGALLVVAHQPGTELGTHAVTAADLQAMFRDFALVRSVPTTLAGAAAALFELQRRTDG